MPAGPVGAVVPSAPAYPDIAFTKESTPAPGPPAYTVVAVAAPFDSSQKAVGGAAASAAAFARPARPRHAAVVPEYCAAPATEPRSLRLCTTSAQWWSFGLGFLCPLIWLAASAAPVFACKAVGSAAVRARFSASQSATVAWSLNVTASVTALIMGSIAAALLIIWSGHGNGAGGLGEFLSLP